MARRTFRRITDRGIEAIVDFAEGETHVVWDDRVHGLQIRCGKRRHTWAYVKEHRDHGKRSLTYRRLGFWPALTTAAARKAALIEAGRAAAGRIEPGKRSAVKLAEAMAQYLGDLKEKSRGQWPRIAEGIWRNHIEPTFGKWSLAELSRSPAAVAKWHKSIKSAASADHAARMLSSCYKQALKLDRKLPPHLPTSAVKYHPLVRSEVALELRDFPKWFEAWERIDDPIRRAYQMIALCCGARSGELSRVVWADVKPREHCFIIRNSKSGADIRIPFSLPIVRELKRARDAAVAGNPHVFPGRFKGTHVTKPAIDGLPAYGTMLRRTYRTLCVELKIDELRTHFLMGHKVPGISAGYIAKAVLSSGRALRDDQRRISTDIVKRLGLRR
jgi:integrase